MKKLTNMINDKEKRENLQLAKECLAEGVKLLQTGKLKMAEEMVRRGISIYESVGEVKKTASSLNVLSIILDEIGNDALCMDSMLEAVDLSLSIEAYDLASKVYNNLGSKFMYLRDYDRALEYFKLSLEMFEKAIEAQIVSDFDSQAYVLILNINIALTYCSLGNYEEARKYYLVAKEKSKHPYCEGVLFTFKCSEVKILWEMKEKEEAAQLVDSTIEALKECEYSADFLETVADLLEVLKGMKAVERWKEVLEILESRASEDVNIYDRITLLEHWLDFYQETGDIENYNEKSSRYYELIQEKEVHDYDKRANMLVSMIELRKGKKEKEKNDKIVYMDPLTGIGNRNRMISDSEKLIDASAQTSEPITIGLIDIDFFKECNDTYGHIVGDECLKKVAETLSNALGEGGSIYRYGGDEFLILAMGMDENDVLDLGKAIKDKFDEIQIQNEKSQIVPYITVSQGYTQVYASKNETIEKLIASADNVLYSVKRNGRNNYKFTRYIDICRGDI